MNYDKSMHTAEAMTHYVSLMYLQITPQKSEETASATPKERPAYNLWPGKAEGTNIAVQYPMLTKKNIANIIRTPFDQVETVFWMLNESYLFDFTSVNYVL